MEEGREERPSCSLSLVGGQGRAHWLLTHSDMPHPPDSLIQLQLTSQSGLLPCPEAVGDREDWVQRPTKGTTGQQMRLEGCGMMERVLRRGVMTRGAQGSNKGAWEIQSRQERRLGDKRGT